MSFCRGRLPRRAPAPPAPVEMQRRGDEQREEEERDRDETGDEIPHVAAIE